MKCPKCKDRSEVLHTDAGASNTKRRRRCLNPSCQFRFITREQASESSAATITTESVMSAMNLKRGRNSSFDAEAVAAAIAVDKRRAQMRREQRAQARAEFEDGFEPAPAWLDRGGLSRELRGY